MGRKSVEKWSENGSKTGPKSDFFEVFGVIFGGRRGVEKGSKMVKNRRFWGPGAPQAISLNAKKHM